MSDQTTAQSLNVKGRGPHDPTHEQDLVMAREVLALESKGLTLLGESLNGDFSAALDIIDGLSGRVIVVGMGKSGHVGRKIAATLASTGTPAFFVHPAEASHGDLGMITRTDAVLALSNSGETAELGDVIAHATRSGIPLISISSNANSTLAQASTIALVLPPANEACSLGLAPTTSTTMTLALGDAIAVALLQRAGFTSDDFQSLHPGGNLGRRLMRVSDIMHHGDDLPVITPDMAMTDILVAMTAKRFGCVGVTDQLTGALLGMITDGDLRRHMANDILDRSATEIMTANPFVIAPDLLVTEATAEMNNRKITNLFVVADQKPVGIIHIHDCLRAGVS